jgi:very-short-patch-repair endonuclease
MDNLLALTIFLVILAVLAALIKFFPILRSTALHKVYPVRRSTPLDNLPYRKRWYLLSQAERPFYEVLRTVVGKDMYVFTKVRLLDLLWLPENTRRRLTYIRRVMSKHVDFVLCDRQTVSPVLVVELDDSSHEILDRQERDAFVNKVLRTAGLPILRVRAMRSYVPNELAEMIRKEISRAGFSSE